MSERNYFAPVFIEKLWLAGINFSIERDPADSMHMNLSVSIEKTPMHKDEDGARHEAVDVYVDVFLVNDEDEDDTRLSASAHIYIEVGVDYPDLADDDAESYLTRNAVSMSYSHARSCLMSVTSLSPMSGLILPPVLPDELIKESMGTKSDK